MFGTEENLTILENNQHWFVDGTFKVSPELFFQLFTVHVLIDKSCVPLIYVLLKNKSEATYIRVFQKLLELKPTLNPRSILSDYEKAIQNAVAQVFNNIEIFGCLFHLGQSLWRNVQELNLTERYVHDDNVRVHIKMLLAPVGDVVRLFEEIVEDYPDEINPIIDYWEDTYIERIRRNRCRRIYRINIWRTITPCRLYVV